MLKTPTYNRRASAAYRERLKAKGFTEVSVYIPATLRQRLLEFKDQLLAEYKAITNQEAK